MIDGKKLVVVLPAYNAADTLELTFNDMPKAFVDEVILVDDRSRDETVAVAKKLGISNVHVHAENRGYGGNQKTCYTAALDAGADVIVMLHPDYQYEPKLLTAMAGMVASGVYGVVLGSRILGGGSTGALAGGMPLWKYIANRGAHLRAERDDRREAFRVSLGLSRVLARNAPGAPAAREFRRLRLRQPDAGASHRARHSDRRDLVPHALSRRLELHQLRAVGAVRIRRAGDIDFVSRVALGPRAPRLPRLRTQADSLPAPREKKIQ